MEQVGTTKNGEINLNQALHAGKVERGQLCYIWRGGMEIKTTKTSSKQMCVGKGTSTGSRTQATTTDTTTSAGNNNDSATATVGEVQCFVDDDYDSSIEFGSITSAVFLGQSSLPLSEYHCCQHFSNPLW